MNARLIALAGGGLGAVALIVFGAGWTVGRFNAVYANGVAAGRAEAVAEQAAAIEAARREAAERAKASKLAYEARLREASDIAAKELSRYEEELAEARRDPVTLSCDARPYPVGLRIDQTAGAGNGAG